MLIPPQNDLNLSLEGLNKYHLMVIKKDLFDGRLISLNQTQIANIKELGKAKVLAETNGAKVLATETSVPGFDIKVVIKELHIDKDDLEKMRSITNEKLASRILHFGIFPLLAYHDALLTDRSVRHGYYYFVSPYFEGGDLLKAIEEDTNSINRNDTNRVRLSQKTRLKIIYQVASAISYLHTPVKDFRNDVLHMDIKSLNIVLDMKNNARLIDFGLAREMTEPNAKLLVTSSPLAGTVGYFPTTKFEGLTKCHDYHNFGVVIRELLTGVSPAEMFEKYTLRTMSTFLLEDKIQDVIWKNKTVWKALLKLTDKCLKSLTENKAASTFQISHMLEKLEWLMRDVDAQKWTEYSKVECEVCVVNPAVEESEFLEHEETCSSHIKVCASCMRNSFLNPIMCHTCETKLEPFIGKNWGAILIAGNDKDPKVTESFTNDVRRLKDVITSRSVPVMCIREESIKVVIPDEHGKEDNKMWGKVQNAFVELSMQSLKTLIVVYSGHHGFQTKHKNAENENQKSIDPLKSVTGSKIEDNDGFFKLSENELLKDVELCNEIQKLTTVNKILIFEDCCHGDAEIKNALKDKTVVQFNSSTTTSTSPVDFIKKESKFIGALIKALTATEETKQELYQHTDCTRCKEIANTLFSGSFITVNTFHTFISNYIEHCKNTEMKSIGRPTISLQHLSGKDCILAYRYNFPVVVQFKIKKPKADGEMNIPLSLNQFENVAKLKEFLLRKILMFDFETSLGIILTISVDNSSPISSTLQPMYGATIPYMACLCTGDDDCTNHLVEKEDQLKAYAAAVSIQVEQGPREVHLKEIDTLEQASSAWIARKELIAQIRKVAKIDFQNYDVADILLPNDVDDIFKRVKSVSPHLCSYNPSEESERFIVEHTNFIGCFEKLKENRRIAPASFVAFLQSLDHINTFLNSKHEAVSNVKIHIVFPKNNAEGFPKIWPLIYFHLEIASSQP